MPQDAHAEATRIPPYRPVTLGPQHTILERKPNGIIYARSPDALGPVPATITDSLVHWARATPDAVFVARRGADGAWAKVTYAQAFARVQRLGAGLLARGLDASRPLAILSGNSIEHLLLALAALHAGIPYAPVSTAYSLISKDFGKLRHVAGVLTPGLVFADDGVAYGPALKAIASENCEIVTIAGSDFKGAVSLKNLEGFDVAGVAEAHERIRPHDPAKFLFTSGSTGLPKAVINTQRMLCANIMQIGAGIPALFEQPQILVDWLPWNHTFGGNHNVHIVMQSGGTLYIDDGKPAPGGFAATLRNLGEIAPTVYFSVPKGFEMLVPALDENPALARHFFSRLAFIMYAGASLPQHVWDGLDRVSAKTTGERIRIVTGLGATETAPSAMFVTQGELRAGMVGTPVPACELKLVPNAGKLEARFRGPNVTPGYWRAPEATANAFDEEGFYKIGDALRFVDEKDPDKGFFFDGRVSEDFKLSTGTWVSVGTLRAKMIAHFAPFLRDVVIAGHDRESLGAILLLDLDGCFATIGLARHLSPAEQGVDPILLEELEAKLVSFLSLATGASTRVLRAVVLDDHPSIDHGEITDKGSINQRAMLAHRDYLVKELFAETPSKRVLTAG